MRGPLEDQHPQQEPKSAASTGSASRGEGQCGQCGRRSPDGWWGVAGSDPTGPLEIQFIMVRRQQLMKILGSWMLGVLD